MDYETIKFDSVGELADHVKQIKDAPRKYKGHESTDNYDPSFYGDWTIDDAIECGLAGGNWQQGADAMPRVNVPHETLSGDTLPTPYIDSGIQGFAPNVPNYLSGMPDDMLDIVETDAGDKLLRVAVHVGRYASCVQEHILNRGSAIMAVLDQLSLEGYSIELHAIWRNSDQQGAASVETCIKHGTDHWSPASVAFALCHASFQRRLCWRTAENMKGRGGSITGRGYGSGMAAEFKDYDISFGYVDMNADRHLGSMASAVKYIKKLTLEQLNARK